MWAFVQFKGQVKGQAAKGLTRPSRIRAYGQESCENQCVRDPSGASWLESAVDMASRLPAKMAPSKAVQYR